MFSTTMLLSQVHEIPILITTQLQKLGFPCHMPYDYFLRHFTNSWPDHSQPTPSANDLKEATEKQLIALNISPNDYRLDQTQVFLRPGALDLLKENRNIKTNEWVVQLQALLRGCVLRLLQKKMEKLRQRNNELERKHDKLEEMLNRVLADNEKLRAEKEELEQKLHEQNEVIGNLEQELERSKIEIDNQKASKQHFKKFYLTASRKAERFQNKLKHATKLISATKRTQKGLTSQLEILRDQLNIQWRAKQKAKDRSKRLALQLIELQIRLVRVRDRKEFLTKKNKVLVLQNCIYRSNIEEQSSEIDDIQSRNIELTEELRQCDLQLTIAKQTIAALEKTKQGSPKAKLIELNEGLELICSQIDAIQQALNKRTPTRRMQLQLKHGKDSEKYNGEDCREAPQTEVSET